MARARLDDAADLSDLYVLWSDLERVRRTRPMLDDLIGMLRTAREADAAALIKQQRDGRFKVSVGPGARTTSARRRRLRRRRPRLAAGYTSDDGPAETIAKLRAALLAQPCPRERRTIVRRRAPDGLL